MNRMCVKVTFNNQYMQCSAGGNEKKYSFLTTLKLKFGDMVVVDCATGLQVCTVYEVNCALHNSPHLKWVVQRVNLKTHNDRMEKLLRVKYLQECLEVKRAEFDTMQVYNIMADVDAEAKKLLDELKELSA